jgi:MoaA/NifB/PqqE/SkfB family radical SAM enzyme
MVDRPREDPTARHVEENQMASSGVIPVKRRTRRVTLARRLGRYLVSGRYASTKRKPKVVLRALRNHVHLLLTGEARLRSVSLSVSYRCNLRCIHCSAAKFMDRERKDLGIEDFRRLGDELARNGAYIIQLTGGEPLLRKDLEDIVRALDPSRFYLSINTNTTLVTSERLRSLKAAGVDNFAISIDEWDAAGHEHFRKRKGIHAHSVEVLDMILEAGLSVMVFAVVTHQNVRSQGFLDLCEFTKRKGVVLVAGWAVPCGNWNGNDEVLLTPDDLEYLETIHERYLHVRTDFEANYHHWGCPAVKEKLYITSYGDVVPCDFLHVGLGNVFRSSIADIRRNALQVEWFAEYNALCLACNDRDFQEQHLRQCFAAPKDPVPLEDAGFSVPQL